jgi:hypothetical protein
MPPKEARLGHAIFRAWFFCFAEGINKINKMKSGNSAAADSANSVHCPPAHPTDPKGRSVEKSGSDRIYKI